MSRLPRFAVLLCFAPLAGATAPAVMARLPLRFEANQGQAPADVRYTARAGSYTLQLAARGPSVLLGSHRVDISLVGGNRAPRIDPLEPLAARTNYFIGRQDQWRTNVRSFARVRYASVYRGIDMVYYGNQSQLEYDFVVAPGSDPRSIRMRFQGANRVRISDTGDLLVDDMIQKRPVIYQDNPRREVAGRYVLLGKNTVGVRVADYDRSRELVIDPVLTYLSYMGGTGGDRINASKLVGNKLYLTGQTTNQDLGSTDGAYNPTFKGLTDMFVAIVDVTPGALSAAVHDVLRRVEHRHRTRHRRGLAGFRVPDRLDHFDRFPAGRRHRSGHGRGHEYGVIPGETPAGVRGHGRAVVFDVPRRRYGRDDRQGCRRGTGRLGLYHRDHQGRQLPAHGQRLSEGPLGSPGRLRFQNRRVRQACLFHLHRRRGDRRWPRDSARQRRARLHHRFDALRLFPDGGLSAQPFRAGAQDVVVDVLDMSKSGEASLIYGTFYGGSGNEEVRGMSFDAAGHRDHRLYAFDRPADHRRRPAAAVGGER